MKAAGISRPRARGAAVAGLGAGGRRASGQRDFGGGVGCVSSPYRFSCTGELTL